MKQSRAEEILKKIIKEDPDINKFYKMVKEYGLPKDTLLNALHRKTSIPKAQIVNYLNNRKGFNYEKNLQGDG
jgi:hypothetical protein